MNKKGPSSERQKDDFLLASSLSLSLKYLSVTHFIFVPRLVPLSHPGLH